MRQLSCCIHEGRQWEGRARQQPGARVRDQVRQRLRQRRAMPPERAAQRGRQSQRAGQRARQLGRKRRLRRGVQRQRRLRAAACRRRQVQAVHGRRRGARQARLAGPAADGGRIRCMTLQHSGIAAI